MLIGSFGYKCVIIKGVLHSEKLKEHVVTIGVEKQLIDSDMYEYICLENIKKLYKSSGKCDDQHKYKAILE